MERDQVEEIKSKVDILEIIGARVNLKKAGRHYKGLCPFHSEKSPSFIVSPERQSYKCFGCQESGDVFSFLQAYDGMSFLEALEMLAAKVGIKLVSYRPTVEDSRRKRLLEILDLASEYYRYLLKTHESGRVARDYLANRGVISESIEKFYLGYAPPQWRGVSDFLMKKKGFSVEELDAAGLIIRKDGGDGFYDRFRGRVMFPLRDHKGVVVGFSGRTLSTEPTEAKYINSPETITYHKSKMLYGLWENREMIRKDDKIVLVEGELDVIPSTQAGVKCVVAIKGSAFTEEQAQLIARYSRNIYMSLDSDLAGQEAIKRAVYIADKLDLSIRVVQIKGGKDPGDVATENPKAWRDMVKGAVLYWDFLLDSASARYDPKSGSGAEEISREVVPALSQISNAVVRSHYANKLAKMLSIPEESIYAEITRHGRKKELNYLKEKVSKIETGVHKRSDELSFYALALALQYYPQLSDQIKELELSWIAQPAAQKIMSKLVGLADGPFVISEFAKSLPEELLGVLDTAYLRDLSRVTEVVKEWEMIIVELEGMSLRERLKEITTQIGKVESSGGEQLVALQAEFSQISRRLSALTK